MFQRATASQCKVWSPPTRASPQGEMALAVAFEQITWRQRNNLNFCYYWRVNYNKRQH
ncbi:hypothetical protein GBA52_024965 [Prunus armeniaca]|nr:hypothetical protein GBA52_024965 [Prunus armeniaca]